MAIDEYSALRTAVQDGTLTHAGRKDLERFAMLLCKPKAHEQFQQTQWAVVCDTVRLMLMVRLSEETQNKALRIATVALVVSCFALLAGFVDAGVGLYGLSKKEPVAAITLYRSSTTQENMRVHVATFDADEREEYNLNNCDIAQGLFASQPGIKVKYWCEKGRYRK